MALPGPRILNRLANKFAIELFLFNWNIGKQIINHNTVHVWNKNVLTRMRLLSIIYIHIYLLISSYYDIFRFENGLSVMMKTKEFRITYALF